MKSESARERLHGLYAITPESDDTRELVARVEQCLAGGAALIQYRAKNAAPALALEQARALAAACRKARVPLIVNDSLELALAVEADGVHVGRDDIDVRRARAALPRGIVGASCYDDPQLARAAAAAGADYVAIGSVFASPTKPDARRARLESLATAKRVSGLPVAAIGGITLENAVSAVRAGADLLAVISAVFDAPDVEQAARSFARLFETAMPANAHVRTQQRAL
jgi:thiamine-phosphate pyrophosphorylase